MSTSSLPSFIKIHQAVLEKKSKMWKVYGRRRTDGRRWGTDDGRCSMTIAHLSLKLRWAKKGGPCRCRMGMFKNPTKCLWRWEPNCRYNFYFSLPAHLCRQIYNMWRKAPIHSLTPTSHSAQWRVMIIIQGDETLSHCKELIYLWYRQSRDRN